jgi:hypothetical protein
MEAYGAAAPRGVVRFHGGEQRIDPAVKNWGGTGKRWSGTPGTPPVLQLPRGGEVGEAIQRTGGEERRQRGNRSSWAGPLCLCYVASAVSNGPNSTREIAIRLLKKEVLHLVGKKCKMI